MRSLKTNFRFKILVFKRLIHRVKASLLCKTPEMKNVLFLVLILLLGCQTQQKESPNPHHPEKKVVFEGLNHPWSIAFLSEDEALVSEKDGDLVKIDLVSRTKTILKGFPKDLTDSIRAYSIGDNSGIFEVLLDPDFKKNQWVYFSYAAKKHGEGRTTKVVRAQLENDSLVNHQTLSIPKDNPDFGEGAIPGIYAMGIRAAQGLTIHPETKAIWFSEHGTIQGDEINMLSAGANYGWPNVTSGKLRSPNYKPPKLPGVSFTSPVWFWPHTVAPTGLTFYTGADFPDWKNSLLVPGLSRGSLWRFRIENDTVKSAEELFIDDRVRIRKVRQSPQGKLYILTDEDDGKLIQIIPKTYSNSQ